MPALAFVRSTGPWARSFSFVSRTLLYGCLLLPSWQVAAAPSAGDFPTMDQARTADLDLDRPAPVEIPDAPERSTLPNAGPFFDVRDIRITGITDDPELELYVEQLIEVGREALAIQADVAEIETQGSSDEELQELARFVEERLKPSVPGMEGEELPDDAAERMDAFTKQALMDELLRLLNEQEERRGINVFDLQAVARAVQNEIRGKGLILAYVVVPPQRVEEGVVELRVFPGRLGQVAVVNNSVYDSDTLEGAFAEQIGEDVRVTQVEETLRLVNDFGGMDVSGVFVPGSNPGETRLELNVINERRWAARTRVDNQGANVTGRTRALLGVDVFDVTGGGDTLSASVLRSEGPNEVTLANLSYVRPIMGVKNFVAASFSSNEFTIGAAAGIKVDTETQNYEANFGHHWLRTRERNLTQTVDLYYKDADVSISPDPTGILSNQQKMVEFGSTLAYDTLVPSWRMIIDGSTAVRVGNIRSGEFEGQLGFPGQDKNFYIASQSLRIYKLFDMDWPLIDASTTHSMLVRINGQFSEQSLPSVDRLTLGGADGVRSLLSEDVSVDKGLVANFQFYWEVPEAWDRDLPWANQRLSEAIRPYVFYDYAYGVQNATRINAANTDDQWFEFGGYGVGLEYNFFKNARGNYNVHGSLNWAWPEKSRFGSAFQTEFERSIEDEDRIYVDITFEFDQATLMGLSGRGEK